MFVKNPYLDILICFVGTFFTTYVLHLLLEFGDHSLHENWSLHLAQAIGLTTGLALFSTLGSKQKSKHNK